MLVKHREEVLNVALAECLAGFGFNATPESIQAKSGGRGRALPDVLIQYRGMRIAIEGKYADVTRAREIALSQAKDRVVSGISQIAIAVLYPSSLRSCPFPDLRNAISNSKVAFHVLSDVSANGAATSWRSGQLPHFHSEIKRVHESICKEDVVQAAAESIRGSLAGVANLLETRPGVCEELSKLLGMGKPEREDAELKRRRMHTVTRVAALTLENAFIFQEQLAASGTSEITSLRELLRHKNVIGNTIKHWDWICAEINYVPIFRLATAILARMPAQSASEGAVRVLAENALEVSANEAALRHDLMGRVYHYLLHEAKFLGTYYTSVPAATMLAKLALDLPKWHINFSKLREIGGLRITDLSCGTGTLLMAACQAVADNFVVANVRGGVAVTERKMSRLHSVMMESVLYGYDVLPSAIHLTASTLSLLAPEVLFQKLHLYSMPLTVSNGNPLLGSLEFIEQEETQTQFSLFDSDPQHVEPRQYTSEGPKGAVARVPKSHLFIMNPPFTRSVGDNLLFGNLSGDKRTLMQESLKGRVARRDLSANITAGLGSVFVAVASQYLQPGGRLAFVLPAALATGVAWEKTRHLIQRDYHLEYVVVSHEPGRWNFSENTDLSELLFVARKLRNDETNERLETAFINLWHNPANAADALALTRLVHSSMPVTLSGSGTSELADDDLKYGEILSVPMKLLSETWWPTGFAQTPLLRAAWWLRHGRLTLPGIPKVWAVPVTDLGSIADIGPDRRDVHDGFEPVSLPTPFKAFWNHDASKTFCIAQKPNKYLSPRASPAPGRKHIRKTEQLWPKAGALLLAERLRFNTQRLTAICLEDDVLTNTWWPVRFHRPDRRKDKALALWQNSTFGLAIVALSKVSTEGSWVQFKKPSLLAMAVLDVDRLQEDQLTALATAFDRLGQHELRPFSSLADDDVRIAIDLAVASALGVPDPIAIREMLAREPSLSNSALRDMAPKRAKQTPQMELLFG